MRVVTLLVASLALAASAPTVTADGQIEIDCLWEDASTNGVACAVRITNDSLDLGRYLVGPTCAWLKSNYGWVTGALQACPSG